MKFNWTPTTPRDYKTICDWGKFWRFPIPPSNFLPDNGLGGIMVIGEDGKELCCGFLYETNSSACWMEYIISNPEIKDKVARKESIEYLVSTITEIARNRGYEYVFTVVKNENLINKYLSCGFVKGTQNSTEMIKVIN